MTRLSVLRCWIAVASFATFGCAASDADEALPQDATAVEATGETSNSLAAAQPAALGASCLAKGTLSPAYAALDSAAMAFLRAQGVANAQLAVSKSGATLMSRAYTCPGAVGAATETSTMFRLASNSKAWTSAAIHQLIQKGSISRSTRAFSYLGIVTPLPQSARVDPRVYSITVGNLIDHQSGWNDSLPPYFEPTHRMRDIAVALNLKQPITAQQMVRYMLGIPLQETPGTNYAYCNFCYDVLGMIVEKASGTTFSNYITQSVARPLGVTNIAVSPTLEPRLPGEVARYFSQYVGLSAINVTSTALVPGPNGGDSLIREVGAPAAGLATSAASMLKLMDRYLIWGVGTAPGVGYDWARSGSDEGTSTWAEQRADLKRWALLINTRAFATSATAFDDFVSQVNQTLDSLP
jgi:CubicO group peptidase (beta-lactamase class C family)